MNFIKISEKGKTTLISGGCHYKFSNFKPERREEREAEIPQWFIQINSESTNNMP